MIYVNLLLDLERPLPFFGKEIGLNAERQLRSPSLIRGLKYMYVVQGK